MNQLGLFDLMQNQAVSAIALQGFILGYHSVAKHKANKLPYPHIGCLFYVLPIVYNQKAVNTFRSSNELYAALLKDNSIILGLQERANKMTEQTFDALNLAFSKKILSYNKSNQTIELMKGFETKKIALFLSMNSSDNSVKKIQDSAFKLGSIFAKRDKINIQFELKIVF